MVVEAFYGTRPAEALQVRQTDLSIAAVIEDFAKPVIRVYKPVTQRLSELERESRTRNRITNQERRVAISVGAARSLQN